MRITYFGHSAFQFQDDEHTVLLDPFLSGNPAATVSPDSLNPQTILLTHAHNDHVGDTLSIAERTGATVIATFELATYFGQKGLNTKPANHGGTVAFAGGTVKLTPAWHTSSYNDGTTFVAPGIPAGMVIRFGGKTVYAAGDTCLFGDMSLIAEEGLDAAILPIGDTFTMGPADAARAAELLRAGVVIPCHYNTFPPLEQDPGRFADLVSARCSSTVVALQPNDVHDL
jgi:L-ascorbate metabolism protein UlaG (beta-lactamase superfamily)